MSSLKLALNLGDGVVMIVSSKLEKPRFFSRSLMCPTSGIAYKNPEPSSFSFNSPRGSCKDCNGLGVYKSVDLEKIMPNKNLSINKGGLSPLEKNDSQWILNQLEIIGKKHGFSLNTPLNEISEEAINYILYGINEDIKVKLKTAGISKKYKIDFMGIVNFIEEQASFSSVKSIERWANKYMSSKTCKSCNGSRLNIQSSNFKVDEKTITEVVNMDIDSLKIWLKNLILRLNNKHKLIADQIVKELLTRVQFIIDVGLSYLTLNRTSKSLSGGEAQRIRLATQIGTQLTNVLYILDEPSIGLHQRDNQKLIDSLKKLRDIGNSVIVVEHDKDMICNADFVVDMGPEAGLHGGEVVAEGSYKQILKSNNITSDFLNGKKEISIPNIRRKGMENF